MITENGDQSRGSIYQFACPHCGMGPIVDEAVREDMLKTGCYLCKRAVDTGDFRLIE